MAVKITKRLVDAVTRVPQRHTIWDSSVKGFGLRISPSGQKTYVLKYRNGHGRAAPTRLIAIGEHGSPWTAEAARVEAVRLKGLTQAGQDPLTLRYEEQPVTKVGPLVALFIDKYHRARNNRTVGEVERIFRADVLPRWERRDLSSIGRREIADLIDTIAARGAPVQANRTLVILHKFFGWCMGQGIVASNPATGVAKPAKEIQRDRTLTDEELRVVWRATEKLGWPFGPCVQLMMLTAQRRDEVAGMRWDEIDLAQRLWTLPAARAKNGQAHMVPLSAPAIDILNALPRQSPLVFSTTDARPISGFSKAKARLDKLASDSTTGFVIAPWRLHDLRRTATTGMARLGHPPHVVDKVLNHSAGTIRGVAAIYNRFGYLDERRAALDDWAAHLVKVSFVQI